MNETVNLNQLESDYGKTTLEFRGKPSKELFRFLEQSQRENVIGIYFVEDCADKIPPFRKTRVIYYHRFTEACEKFLTDLKHIASSIQLHLSLKLIGRKPISNY